MPGRLEITESDQAVSFEINLHPRGSRDALEGIRDGRLQVRITAPPVEGRANKGLIKFLARKLSVAPSCINIDGGLHSRVKRIRVTGMDRAELLRRLG